MFYKILFCVIAVVPRPTVASVGGRRGYVFGLREVLGSDVERSGDPYLGGEFGVADVMLLTPTLSHFVFFTVLFTWPYLYMINLV